jgi:hypothetical protein
MIEFLKRADKLIIFQPWGPQFLKVADCQAAVVAQCVEHMFKEDDLLRDIDDHEKHVVVPGELRSLQPGVTFDVQVRMARYESEKVLLVG